MCWELIIIASILQEIGCKLGIHLRFPTRLTSIRPQAFFNHQSQFHRMTTEQQQTWEWPGYTKVIHRSAYRAISPLNPDNSTAGKVVVVTGKAFDSP